MSFVLAHDHRVVSSLTVGPTLGILPWQRNKWRIPALHGKEGTYAGK